jgi:hypothetical protein
MKRSPAILTTFSIAALLLTSASAMNGKYVTITGGNMALYTIQSSAVSGNQTLSSDQIISPCFSFDGTKIACWRNSGGKWYLSIMNVGSRTFINLLDISSWTATTPKAPMGGIRWPAGDWIYFIRPDGTTEVSGEVWRINSADPSKKEMILDYVKPTDPNPKRMFNFYLSPDVRLAMIGVARTSGQWTSYQPIHYFPPTDDDPFCREAMVFDLPNCNPCVAPTGSFSGRFKDGMHEAITLYQWNESAKTYSLMTTLPESGCNIRNIDLEAWSGASDWAGTFEAPDWAVNSDQWIVMEVGLLESGGDLGKGCNSVAFSWKDQKCIKITNNGAGAKASTGSLFVEGGAANSWQDINNNWTSIQPIELLPRIDATGSVSPYRITLSSKPAGADLYYTTDGSDPTQSSTKYIGPVNISVPADRVLWLKAKAFMAGKTPSNLARKLLYPCAIKSVGLTCNLWKNVAGTQISDLLSNSRYPNNPDQTWIGPNLDNQFGNPWGYVQGDPYSNFGYRLHGYVIAPMTGSYVFKLSSNTSISLRLGTSSDPASAREVAQITLSTTSDPGSKVASSSPITLQAGNWYFIEQIVKGGAYWTYTGGSWQVSGQDMTPDMILMPADSVPHSPVRSIRPDGAIVRGAAPLSQPASGVVYDVLGNRVSTTLGSRGLSSSRLPVGIYFVKVGNGRGGEVRRMVVRGLGAR